jgi:hypothetical protein
MAMAFSALLLDDDEPAFRQYFNVPRNGRTAHRKSACYRIQIQRSLGQYMNDLPPGRVGYCLKNISSHEASGLLCYKYNVTVRLRNKVNENLLYDPPPSNVETGGDIPR